MLATRRVGLLAAVALVSTVVLSGCMPVMACPAIGWSNSLRVVVEGDTSAVADVRICAGSDCASGSPVQRCDDVECKPADPTSGPSRGHREGNIWSFDLMMSQPQQVTVRVLAVDESVPVVTTVHPNWVRVGGSERCGGPAEASVTVEV